MRSLGYLLYQEHFSWRYLEITNTGRTLRACIQYIRHRCRKIGQSFPKLISSNSGWEFDLNPLGLRGQSSFLLPWESLVKASQSSAVAQRKSDLGFHSPPARANFPEDSSILDHWGNFSPLRWGCAEWLHDTLPCFVARWLWEPDLEMTYVQISGLLIPSWACGEVILPAYNRVMSFSQGCGRHET